ncbi:nitrite/sulfite reductase [Couchioplanes caeruleus]|uniref:nitrite/sulfite reductase n=1 Tax=Couchioplanes caeruleus TaxID=56438 RepID=UPI001FD5A00E|nr:nitrite/sulfite reductase [Couchioplanes caeruleus]
MSFPLDRPGNVAGAPPGASGAPGASRALGGARADSDACPGALRLHDAADGPLARVRIPGGRITGIQMAALRALAEEYGDGHVELTSRANLQLRALRGIAATRLAERFAAAGVLPSATHELVRNIAGSPLLEDAAQVTALDEALCADPVLATLPGRFLFAIDDGTGDVAHSADVAALPRQALPGMTVLFAGRDVGLRVRSDQVVGALLAAGHAFLTLAAQDVGAGRRRPWRVRELADGPARMAAHIAAALGVPLGEPDPHLTRPVLREPIGVVPRPDARVAVGALVPLGRLGGDALRALESAETLVVTPWRGVVVPGLPADRAATWMRKLAGAGLETAAGSRWTGVTSCAGLPGCAKALADVRADADATTLPGAALPVHWVGCARGCGSPQGPHVRVEATGSGYLVHRAPVNDFTADGSVPVAEVAALVAAVRKG